MPIKIPTGEAIAKMKMHHLTIEKSFGKSLLRRKRKRKDITLPTVPKLKTVALMFSILKCMTIEGPECVQEMFPNGLPFPKSALTSHGMKE